MPTRERWGAVGDEPIRRVLERPRAALVALIGVDLDRGLAGVIVDSHLVCLIAHALTGMGGLDTRPSPMLWHREARTRAYRRGEPAWWD